MARKQPPQRGGTALLERLEARVAATYTPIQTVDVELKSLYPNPKNERARFDKSDPELARSIQQLGLLNPPTVGMPDAKGRRMILAGHRRVAALRELKLERITVRVVTDDQVDDTAVLVSENSQREDLDPLVESAHVLELLARDGATHELVAAELGRTRAWVSRRARLSNLGKVARAARARADHPLSRWPVAWLEELALVDHEAQADLLENDDVSWIADLQDLRRGLARHFTRLDSARFPLDDAELVPKAGACATCTKHSAAQPGLFDGAAAAKLATATCLDTPCFQVKVAAYVKRQHAALVEKSGGATAVAILSNRRRDDPRLQALAKATGAEVVDGMGRDLVKKASPGATPFVRDDGEVVYEPAAKPARGAKGRPVVKPKPKVTSMAERVAMLEGRRRKHVVLAVAAHVEALLEDWDVSTAKGRAAAWKFHDEDHALQLLGAYGAAPISGEDGFTPGMHDVDRMQLAKDGNGVLRLAYAWLQGVHLHVLSDQLVRHVGPASQGCRMLYTEAQAVVELARWQGEHGWDAFVQRAEVALARPKSWGPLPSAATKPGKSTLTQRKGKGRRKGKG